MSRIPEATLDAIRERTDLVALIGRHVALKRAGRSHKGLCPFHNEKTPSFSVNGDSGYYYCFGCGAKGNAFSFLIEHENLTFPEAAKTLAAECGIELALEHDGPAGLSEAIESANHAAQVYFASNLASERGEGARDYLEKRDIDSAAMTRFELGFAPDSWDGLVSELRRQKVPMEQAERAGLLKARRDGGHYDLMRGRVTFPIRDPRGRIIAFGGRALGEDQEPKYLNSPETPLFRKREAFYGFPDALEPIRKNGRAVVVEGYFDRMALAVAGLPECVATCGTALSEGHAKNLRRRSRHVTLLFDGDSAGRRAALRSLEVLLPAGLRVSAAALPEGCDPDDYLRSHGADALRKLVEDAPPALDLAIAEATSAGCTTPWEQADAVASVTPYLSLIKDPVERGAYARRLSLAVGVEVVEVESALRASARGEAPEEALAPRAPRLQGPTERRLADAVRLGLRFSSLSAPLRELMNECRPPDPWPSIIDAALDAAASGDVIKAAEMLPAELQGLLLQLAEDADAFAEDTADRAFSDTASWLRRAFARQQERATTHALRSGGNDPVELLLRKQQELEARRAAQRSRSHAAIRNDND